MKDNKKVLIIVIILVVLIGLSITAIVISNNIEEPVIDNPNTGNSGNSGSSGNNVEKNYDYLAVNNTDLWRVYNNSWERLEEFDTNNKKFNVYVNNTYFGKYYLKYVTSWNLFDNNNSYVDYNGKIFAYSEGLNVNLKNFIKLDITLEEVTEINNIIESQITLESLSYQEKIIIDLDSNGISDKVVSVSNIDSSEQEIYFNLVYVVLNGNNHILINNLIKEEDLLNEPIYNIQYIINLDNSECDNIIIQEGYFSNAGDTKNVMFQYTNSRFIEVIGD